MTIYKWDLKIWGRALSQGIHDRRKEKGLRIENTPMFKDWKHEEPAKETQVEWTRQEEA